MTISYDDTIFFFLYENIIIFHFFVINDLTMSHSYTFNKNINFIKNEYVTELVFML